MKGGFTEAQREKYKKYFMIFLTQIGMKNGVVNKNSYNSGPQFEYVKKGPNASGV